MKDEIMDSFKSCFKEFYQDLNPFASHFEKNQNGEIYFKINGQFCFILASPETSRLVYRSIPKDIFDALSEQSTFETITNKEIFKLLSRYIINLLCRHIGNLQSDVTPDDFEANRNELDKYTYCTNHKRK